jgi:hypothetical protein
LQHERAGTSAPVRGLAKRVLSDLDGGGSRKVVDAIAADVRARMD